MGTEIDLMHSIECTCKLPYAPVAHADGGRTVRAGMHCGQAIEERSLKGLVELAAVTPTRTIKSGATTELRLELRNTTDAIQPVAFSAPFEGGRPYIRTFDGAKRKVSYDPADRCRRFGSAYGDNLAVAVGAHGRAVAVYTWSASSARGVEFDEGGQTRCKESPVPLQPGHYSVEVPTPFIVGHGLADHVTYEIDVVP